MTGRRRVPSRRRHVSPAAPASRVPFTMAERKPFLLRIDPRLLEQLRRWAADDLRSLNGQIEFLLQKALVDAKRAKDETSKR